MKIFLRIPGGRDTEKVEKREVVKLRTPVEEINSERDSKNRREGRKTTKDNENY
ncbi:hypothetical protein XA3_08710 [Xylocopilactobacillus apicola]|uniref:Uncharacterized protein n=1 Tax=Xylocopilactobacillus apicola TaxID=2932184 RepID=A0AAU9D7Y3_9LACO|nr:hypothetical protein XA3_07820 [Xylocopilactobacillus apicola]BDR58430.1 hypothetical protein XA3_08710 [Xylocopilactobacillus apicola]